MDPLIPKKEILSNLEKEPLPSPETHIPHKPPASATPEEPGEETKKETGDISTLPTLRTYKQDVAQMMRDPKTSLVKIVMEEQKAKWRRREETSPRSKKNFPLVILSSVFLVVSIALVYFLFSSNEETPLQALNVKPFIFVESNKEIVIDTDVEKILVGRIKDEILSANLTLDSMEYIFFTEKVSVQTKDGIVEEKSLMAADKFFSTFDSKMPSSLRRSLKPDYMVGVHAFNKNQPFIILKTDFYDNAFAGMLEWEKDMAEGLFPLFGKEKEISIYAGRRFQDVILKNKDTRMLRDFDGAPVLIYMFKDPRTIVITTSEATLLEVSRRLDLTQTRK